MSLLTATNAGEVIPTIIAVHAEDAAVLWELRHGRTRASNTRLRHLQRFDDRLAAHLDGLLIAGSYGAALCESALDQPSTGAVFAAAICALELKEPTRLDRLFALAEANARARTGLTAAFAWSERESLRGVVASLLSSTQASRRSIAIATCGAHRVDLGIVAANRLEDPSPEVRARVLRTIGQLGERKFVSTCAAAMSDPDPACQFWAAWSAVLLGDRESALAELAERALTDGPFRARAFELTVLASTRAQVHAWLKRLAQDGTQLRWLIRGAGLSGDPAYVAWLLNFMGNDTTARLAGEAFSFITGADLSFLDLDRKPPKQIPSGPNDDPEDPDVEIDADEDLPWPDESRVRRWWEHHASGFDAGVRYLCGVPVSRAQCLEVLRNGFQRQRIAASVYLSVLEPGTPLFEWRAPAWRQQSALARME